jgi:hypothetical protein
MYREAKPQLCGYLLAGPHSQLWCADSVLLPPARSEEHANNKKQKKNLCL